MSSSGDTAPGRLWSLWEMLGKYAAVFLMATNQIDECIRVVQEHRGLPSGLSDFGKVNDLHLPLAEFGKLPAEPGKRLDFILSSLITQVASRIPLASVQAQGRRISGIINGSRSKDEIVAALEELKRRIFDELCEREFLFIPPERVKFYKEPMLFGQKVHDKFPAAIDDIEGAGKCLAVGEGTACVLHLMRVMEIGLKGLAKSLGIPYAPSWESYLSQIATRIGARHKTKGIKWRRDEPFYRDISGDLVSVKQAWRNPTMHVVRKYSPDEAEEIFKAVRTFLIRLADGLKQKNGTL